MKQVFTMLGGLRKAMSELDNAIPDVAFDYDLDVSHIDAVWDEIAKVEKLIDEGKLWVNQKNIETLNY